MNTAWVTGASRGIGRGVAVALGQAGWTVWVTARSSRGDSTSHLPGSVEETAEAVTAAGGYGVGVRCDHRDDDQVRAVARRPLELWDSMFAAGVRAHYVASAVCAPLLRRGNGMILTVSMEAGRHHAPSYGVAYSAAKAADDRLTEAMAGQLGGDGVTVLGLYPGLVRTEGVMQFAEHLDLTDSQSCEGIGRLVAAVAADADRAELGGGSHHAHELARRYDLDILQ